MQKICENCIHWDSKSQEALWKILLALMQVDFRMRQRSPFSAHNSNMRADEMIEASKDVSLIAEEGDELQKGGGIRRCRGYEGTIALGNRKCINESKFFPSIPSRN